jgi:hypothetical protein
MAKVERMLTVTLSIGVQYDAKAAEKAGLDFGGETMLAYELALHVETAIRHTRIAGTCEDVNMKLNTSEIGVAGRWSEDVEVL